MRYDEIKAFHQESLTLQQVTADSVQRFSTKVGTFVAHHPDAKEDPLYPEIQKNVQQVALTLHFEVNDEWLGEYQVNL